MSYWDVSLLEKDEDFRARSIACASLEGLPQPEPWVMGRMWQIAAAPGFSDAYASALAADPPVPNPGRDQAVISDGQLLSRVQELAGGGV